MGDDGSISLSYDSLRRFWRKGFRNGNWRKLSRIEKALYMASLSLAKIRGKIVNLRLVLELRNIIGKLRETPGDRLMQTSYRRAVELYARFVTIGLFDWAPQVRSWFSDPGYILWIGLCSTETFLG